MTLRTFKHLWLATSDNIFSFILFFLDNPASYSFFFCTILIRWWVTYELYACSFGRICSISRAPNTWCWPANIMYAFFSNLSSTFSFIVCYCIDFIMWLMWLVFYGVIHVFATIKGVRHFTCVCERERDKHTMIKCCLCPWVKVTLPYPRAAANAFVRCRAYVVLFWCGFCVFLGGLY